MKTLDFRFFHTRLRRNFALRTWRPPHHIICQDNIHQLQGGRTQQPPAPQPPNSVLPTTRTRLHLFRTHAPPCFAGSSACSTASPAIALPSAPRPPAAPAATAPAPAGKPRPRPRSAALAPEIAPQLEPRLPHGRALPASPSLLHATARDPPGPSPLTPPPPRWELWQGRRGCPLAAAPAVHETWRLSATRPASSRSLLVAPPA